MKSSDDASGPTANPAPSSSKPLLTTLLGRALRLRCPVCGRGRLFRNWFQVYPSCQNCRYCFERGPGYWLGSIYVNYGLTALIVTASYFALFFSEVMTPNAILLLLTLFCFLFPLWFFRYARAIWVAFDLYFDPAQANEFELRQSKDNPH